MLAKIAGIPWDKIFFFWGDERHVPPEHPDSNYRMANETLLSKVPIPPENVFRIHAEEKDAAAAAAEYENVVQIFFHLKAGELPRFDLILLGMGPDGHTASLFPKSAGLNEKKRLVITNWVEKFKTSRLSFTYPVLNAAACVIFLVVGADKAAAVQAVLENPASGLPSQRVLPGNGKLIWLLDVQAARQLSQQRAG